MAERETELGGYADLNLGRRFAPWKTTGLESPVNRQAGKPALHSLRVRSDRDVILWPFRLEKRQQKALQS